MIKVFCRGFITVKYILFICLFIYGNAFAADVIIVGGVSKKQTSGSINSINEDSAGSWPPWLETWISYDVGHISFTADDIVNYYPDKFTYCSNQNYSGYNEYTLYNCRKYTEPYEYINNICNDNVSFIYNPLYGGSLNTHSRSTQLPYDAGIGCEPSLDDLKIDKSYTYSSNYTFKISNCDVNQEFVSVKLVGDNNIISESSDITYDGLMLNGIKPTVTGRAKIYYDENPTFPKTYYTWGWMEWTLPISKKCGETFTVTTSATSGLFYGKFSSISVVKKICSLSIPSLTGNSQIINPTSGGNLAIKGSISDSSDQPVTWTLTTPDGKTTTGTGTSVNETWNGKDASGKVVEPGSYYATLTAQTADGKCTDSKALNIIVTDANDGQCGLYVQFGSSAHMASGNLSHSQELFSSQGGSLPLGLSLYYNSLDPHNGSLGRGWSHTYDVSLKANSDSVLISEGNWKYQYFTLTNGSYVGQPGNYSTLAKNSDGTFTLTSKDGQLTTFTSEGKLTSISDRNGNTQSFTYSGGNPATVTDPSGRSAIFSYDSANHLTSITDPSGNVYSPSVGTSLNTVTQPDGGTWRFTYGANAYMLAKTDPQGNTTSYTYDDQHRVISSADPEGKTRNITYPQTTEAVKSTTFTEKDGGTWSYSYDTRTGTLTSKTDPQGGVTSHAYDANGNLISTINSDGTATSATYDNWGNLLTSTDALGQTTGYTYNSFGQVTSVTDPQGKVTTYVYDSKGNMYSVTDPTGAITSYSYDAKGNITKVTDPIGQITSFTYNAQSNLAAITDASGATTGYGYDTAGNVVSITDPKGGVTKFVYDARNRLIKTIDPQGSVTHYSYDANGNKLSDIDANGNITSYEYNSQNQLIKTTDALGNVTVYAYGGTGCNSCGSGGGNGKLTSLTDANNNVTAYEYDQLGRLIRETGPRGNITSYSYDVKGNLITRTDANADTISYSYDATGRLLKKSYPDNTEETYTYNPNGNLITATNKHISYNISYDAVGRMVSSTDSNGRYLQYSYDNTGRKTQTLYPEGSVVSYGYDTTGRLATITNGGGRTYIYTYDKLGRRTKLSYPNGATASYTYDSAGRLTNLSHKQSNGKTIASFAYTLDKVGNRLTNTKSDTKTTYGYDAIYRLLTAQPNQRDQAETYSYDPVGNRLTGPERTTSYTYGPGNELLKRELIGFILDNNGNLIAKGEHLREHDHRGKHWGHHRNHDRHDNGNEHHGKGWVYTYDFENRLIKAEKKQGHDVATVTYKYDPLGRRIEKRVQEGEHCRDEDEVIHSYVYDGQSIILEYETTGEGRHKKTETTKYVHGPNIDEPLAMTRDNEVYYYHADGLGSIVALTDKRQKTVESYEYDSFGNLKQDDKKMMQPFTYTGREWDKETGLYYYRARYYDPMDGRFISKDPIGFRGGINLYSYVGQNPVNNTDPTGEASLKETYCKKLSGIIGMCADFTAIGATLSGAGAPVGVTASLVSAGNTGLTLYLCGSSKLSLANAATTATSLLTSKYKVFNIIITDIDAGLSLSGMDLR